MHLLGLRLRDMDELVAMWMEHQHETTPSDKCFGLSLADCVNSSPPLISRKFQGFSGIIREISVENSVEFSGVLYGA